MHCSSDICPRISTDTDNVCLQLFTIFSLITNPPKLNALNTAEEVGVAIGKPGMPIGPEHCLEYCLDILLWLFDVSQIEKADH